LDNIRDCFDARNKRQQIKPRLRFSILNRDNFTCRYCGHEAPDVVLHVDHIVPVSQGGTNDCENLITACAECNLGKADLEIIDPSEQARDAIHTLIWRYLKWPNDDERQAVIFAILLSFWRGNDFHRLCEIGEAAKNLAEVNCCLEYLERISEEDE
jgi:hypothetical protein